MSNKQNALASCLFEAIDDINFSNVIVLMEKHGADPNTIIPKLQIAPIHYAVGFEKYDFAKKVTALFLKKNADPNLISEDEHLTPLHISCIWGRAHIVKLLLDHGGDLDLKCSDGQTPIDYAIAENNYQVVEVIQKFVFEKKIDRKKNELILKSQEVKSLGCGRRLEESFSTPIKNNHLKNALNNLEEKKFTPNRINYNFDATSPYFVNITHRRHKTSHEGSSVRENSKEFEVDEVNQTDERTLDRGFCRKNLFELTEKNLKEFSHQTSQVIVIDRLAIHKRRSYIKKWQEKVQQIRKTDANLDVEYINYLNACNDVTLMNEPPPKANINEDTKSSNDSFNTAISDLQRSNNAIHTKQPSLADHFMQEDYIHSDIDSGVVFFEKKIVPATHQENVNLDANEETDHDETRSQSSVSTKLTIPMDYDTDALRTELTHLTGGRPGPITKNTKRLYLKQLVKLRKNPTLVQDESVQKSYSVELQRSISNFGNFEENLSDFLKLETHMSQYFVEHKGHIKFREGNLKTSFIYLLIDPRLSTYDEYKSMSKKDVWAKFVSSIFYVGKGKRARPYSHLYDAIKLFSMENSQLAERLENRNNQIIEKRVIYSNAAMKNEVLAEDRMINMNKPSQNQLKDSKKLNRIVEIWKAQRGVVCLHVFNNIIPCEAYSREAAIIEAIGVENLTNLKKGDYYGVTKNYSMRQKRQLGVGLLHRAMNIYLAEGESQLMPFDLI